MVANALERRWWSRALLLAGALGCAELVGFEDEYYEVSSGARGGRSGSAGTSDGGSGEGGGGDTGGARGGEAGDHGGDAGRAGRTGGTTANGGTSGGPGTGGAGDGGAGDGGAGDGGAGGASGTGGAGEGGNAGAGAGGTTGGAGAGGSIAGTSGVSGGGATGGGGTGGDTGVGGSGAGGDSGTGGGGSGGDAGAGGSGGDAGGSGGTPSCRGLARTCGAEGSSDCCEAPVVPGGTFERLNDPAYEATLSAFALDRYEVSVGRFRKFVAEYPNNKPADGAGKNPNDALDQGWDGTAWNELLPDTTAELESELNCEPGALIPTWTHDPGPNETRPINCVTWHVAFAFCIWDEGRLPTAAESNFAAAGGDEQRLYPWSSGPSDSFITPNHASYFLPGVPNNAGCWGDDELGCTVEDFIPVGSKPLGNARWTHADMAGNVWEWTRDGNSSIPADCTDCANLDTTGPRVARGGGYFSATHLLETSVHLSFDTHPTSTAFGIRCARPVPP